MNIQLKTVFGDLIFEGDFSCIAHAVKAALVAKKSLSYADLSSADLSSADLRSADLRSADLRYADLSYADLSSADLSYADLSSADLSYADLRYADLRSADLRYADLRSIKHDFWAVLTCAKNEVAGLRLALIEGRINGSSYTGDCACLVGTIANVRHCATNALGPLIPDSNRPAECFFLGISTGDKPETNQFSKLALAWLDEWADLMEVSVMPSAAPVGTQKEGVKL